MSKPLPILTQMPWNVKQMIADSADIDTKNALRPASKEFKDVVSQCQIKHASLRLKIDNSYNKAVVKFSPYRKSEMELNYTKYEMGYEVEHAGERNLVTDGNMIEAAVNKFVKVLRNPKVLIESLAVKNSCLEYEIRNENPENRVFHRLQSFFSSLTHHIRVERFSMICNTQNDILKILPYIQPGTLENIHFFNLNPIVDMEMDLSELAGTQQWKSAKQLILYGFNMTLPVEKWSHFTRTTIDISGLTLDKMKSIFNSFLNASQWCSCTFYGDNLVKQSVLDYFKELGTHKINKHGAHELIIQIPNSRETVEVKIIRTGIFLKKR